MMRFNAIVPTCLFAALWAPAASVNEAPQQWTPELSMKVRTITDVLPSPDGTAVVWTERAAVMAPEKSEMNAQIFFAHGDGSHRLQLTRGEKSADAPEFTPDGAFVYFASSRGGKRNVFRIAVDGGEAEQATDSKTDIGDYHLSPNGKLIAFTAPPERPEIETAKRLKTDFRVIDEDPPDLSLYVMTVDEDLSGRRPAKKLVSGSFTVGAFTWSPDSREIAFETRPSPDADIARRSDISEVDVESGNVRAVAATPATETQPRYSPDGRYLAFVRAPGGSVEPGRIVLYSRRDAKERELPASFDEQPNLTGWAADSKELYFVEFKGTRVVLYSMPVDGPARAAFIPKGTLGLGMRLNARGTYAGLALQSPSEPVQAYAMELRSMKPVQVSASNTNLPKLPLGGTQVIRWKNGGEEVEGLLTLPPGYEKGTKIPLILNIHGGPSGDFVESSIGAAGLYPIASFAAQGWAVLRVNPRGSTGYGIKFRAANVDDWGDGDYKDLMTGVDHVIGMGIADPNHMAVMGWSYGGYMTNWVIGQTTRFKAAAAGAGLSNLISMWGTNDIPSTLDDYFSGTPVEHADLYLKMSPLYYVKNVTTPTLILHGEIDPRVPTGQGYEMYNALKRRGVETVMVVYPRTKHGPEEPKFVLDIMRRHVDWVSKHI
jgi:dipeptidyl aminopeptidase/acylaminoacyl peptidase